MSHNPFDDLEKPVFHPPFKSFSEFFARYVHFDEQKDKHQYDDEDIAGDGHHIRRKRKEHAAHHNADIELLAERAL